MPRYRVELRTADRIAESTVADCADLTAFRVEVARFVGELLHNHASEIWVDKDWRVDGTDDLGLILFSMHLFVSDSAAVMAGRS